MQQECQQQQLRKKQSLLCMVVQVWSVVRMQLEKDPTV